MRGLRPEQMRAVIDEIEQRAGTEVRLCANGVQNLAIVDDDGAYRGWVDMVTAELTWLNDQ